MPDLQLSYREGEWDFNSIYNAGEWEPQTHEVLKRFLSPGSLFVDCGAWCGPVSLWALDLGASVIALEPDPEARKALVANTEGRDITILPKAVARKAGLAILAADGYFGDSQSRLLRLGEGDHFVNRETIAVHCVTPRQLFQRINGRLDRHPDLCKVDIEGGEGEIAALLGNLCRQYGTPFLIAWHQEWWQRPIDQTEIDGWFTDLQVDGEVGGWGQSLITRP